MVLWYLCLVAYGTVMCDVRCMCATVRAVVVCLHPVVRCRRATVRVIVMCVRAVVRCRCATVRAVEVCVIKCSCAV